MTLKYNRNCWVFNVDYLLRADRLEWIIIYFIIWTCRKQLNNENKHVYLFGGVSHITEFALFLQRLLSNPLARSINWLFLKISLPNTTQVGRPATLRPTSRVHNEEKNMLILNGAWCTKMTSIGFRKKTFFFINEQ